MTIACVHVYIFSSLAAITRFSSIPVWFFLPILTVHAHAYCFVTHSVVLCIVVVSRHPNPFPFWPRSYIRRTINCPLSSIPSITLLSQHFTIHEHHSFSLFFILRIDLFFFFRVVI